MRTRPLFAISHIGCALLGGGAAVGLLFASDQVAVQAGVLTLGVLFVVGVTWWVSAKFLHGLQVLGQSVTKGQSGNAFERSGIVEFNDLNQKLCEQVQRWTAATTAAREQARDVELILTRIDPQGERREHRPAANGKHLRQLLGDITQSVDADLHQLLTCARDIASSVEEIARGADDQSDVVSKTTTYVEQFSSRVDAVTKSAAPAQTAVDALRNTAEDASTLVQRLNRGLTRVRSYLETNEQKLRSQGDHTREIGSIIETIGSISSRTDLLALNASIESVRAGEHGRGFAIVAEEVHKLAEQAAQATREVAALVESSLVETQESIQLLTQERAEFEAEIERVTATQQAVTQLLEVVAESGGRIAEISTAADEQSLLTQEVVMTIERIATASKTMRNRAEKAGWTTKTLFKLAQQFDSALVPLRSCGAAQSQSKRTLPDFALADSQETTKEMAGPWDVETTTPAPSTAAATVAN